MKRIAVFGASGRMGGEILQVADANQEEFKVLARIDAAGGPGIFESIQRVDPKAIDVVVDFSNSQAWSELFQWAVQHKVPVVSGVTGITAEDQTTLRTASQSIPVIWSPNMSLGVAVLRKVIREVVPLLKSYDFQVSETHHRHKKDRPSGTAIALQEEAERVSGHPLPDILVARGGGVFGVHSFFAYGNSETIEFKHVALNRRVFAEGALLAAKWIVGKAPGAYSMDDVLNIAGSRT